MSKGSAGYNGALYAVGTSTAASQEACTEVSGTVFQITNTARRILDDEVDVVVRVNTVVQATNTYTIDWNFGIITFDSSQTGTTVDITMNYLPRILMAKIRTVGLAMQYDTVDTTAMGDATEDETLLTMRASMSIEDIDPATDEVNTSPSEDVADFFASRETKVWEYQPRTTSDRVYRLRSHMASLDIGGPSTGLVEAQFTVEGNKRFGTLISLGLP